jgi:tetratricopeptide (TPR) repeat protein
MKMDPQDYPFRSVAHRPGFLAGNDAAAEWCALGFGWLYAFNQEEAAHCFRAATAEDDDRALAWWGLAIAGGPFMNMPWDWFTPAEKARTLPACHAAVRHALRRCEEAPPVVQRLIGALALRFPSPDVPADDDLVMWERAYADAMMTVYDSFGDDPDVAALFVESQIMLTPWAVYDVDSRLPNPAGRAAVIHAALDRALAGGGADHVGLLHYDIHAREMSPLPERALASARRLEKLAPCDAGHLQHMPAHICALVGDFDGAARCSRRAVATDEAFRPCLSRAPFYRTLLCHDAHMLMFAGMQVGHFGDAARGAAVMADLLDDVLVAPPTTHMMMTLEGYRSTIAHVDIRFGRWQAVLDRAFDGDPACLPVSRAMHHYARAVAGAALGHAEAAQEAAEAFWQARAAVPAEYAFFNNPADAILEIADLMMRGEMAYHAGEVEMGFELLRRAAAAEDRLGYNEPRAWMHPPRHALGALLLEQGRMAEAAHVYAIDLGYDDSLPISRQNRGNIWALHGLHECWQRLGDDRAGRIADRLGAVRPLADRDITSSCFCRGRSDVQGP